MNPAAILNLTDWALGGVSAFGAIFHAWSPMDSAQTAASILIGSLWQGAVVACGLALCLRLAPSIPARLRYAIWAAGFAALICLPFLSALVDHLTAPAFNAAPAHSLALAAQSASHPVLALDARWSLAIASLWLAASLIRATTFAAHTASMRRLWNSASPSTATDFDTLLQMDAVRSAAPAELCVTNDLDRPCVIGFFRPRILIPSWLLERLTPTELGQVVLHESEHLRRLDDWTNLLQKLCLVIFPLNPALWWIERRLCAEREMACDDAVVSQTQAPRAYAACLANLAERGIEHRNGNLARSALSSGAWHLGAWQRRPELAVRVHRLLRRAPILSPAASRAAVALVSCGLIAATVALARCPQLVAFVAPVHQASYALNASANSVQPGLASVGTDADFSQGRGGFPNSNAQPYRAVKTLAILPAAQPAPLLRNTNSRSRSASPQQAASTPQPVDATQPGHSLASLVPAAIAAKIRSQQSLTAGVSQATESAAQQPTQSGWIVLTTFEEFQSTPSNGTVQGDAVLSETEAKSTEHNASPTGPNSSTSIRVTRLVLHFVQPASKAQPDANTQPAPGASPASNSPQPLAIPYRNGWLVIQL